MEAITNLKELRGSDRTSIFLYIEVFLPLGFYVSLGLAAYLVAVKISGEFQDSTEYEKTCRSTIKAFIIEWNIS